MSVSSTTSLRPDVSTSTDVETSGWHPAGLPTRILYASLVVLFAALMVTGLIGYWLQPHHFNDFYAFNSFSRFSRYYKPSSIYDQDLLRSFQQLPEHKMFAFMYPPTMLLIVWPLGLVPYMLAYVLWVGVGLAACAVLLGVLRSNWVSPLMLLVAPSTLWTALCGQSTLLLTALVLAGMLLSTRRPIIAGVFLGLATYKPQLGMLVPIALIAAGQWRTIGATVVTFLCLVMLSTAAFGTEIWPAWAGHLGSIVGVRSRHTADWAPLLVTISSDLATMGFSKKIADVGQAAALVATVLCIWHCFRCYRPGEADNVYRLRVAGLATATFLATPFAFIYDLPLLTVALLLFVDERRRASAPFHSVEILVIVGGLLAPYVFLIDSVHGCGSIVVLLVLVTILHRIHVLSDQPGGTGLGGAQARA